MYEMVERGLRGGICQVVQKYVKANNIYMTDFDISKKFKCHSKPRC